MHDNHSADPWRPGGYHRKDGKYGLSHSELEALAARLANGGGDIEVIVLPRDRAMPASVRCQEASWLGESLIGNSKFSGGRRMLLERSTLLAIGAAIIATLGSPDAANAQSPRAAYPADRCSFATVSAEDQRRYQSRYVRRVRDKGKEHAEAWLRSWLCPTKEVAERRQQARQRTPTGSDGKPCGRTRTEMRPVSSDGSMTMVPVAVCAE